MDCLKFVKISPDPSFPWFDEYKAKNKLCKVYADGNHYVASIVLPKRSRGNDCRFRSSLDDKFDELYFAAIKSGLSGDKLKSFIKDNLAELYPNEWRLEEIIVEKIKAKQHNLYARKKRFRRKAYLNEWNYFVTFTYDDDYHTEESFKKSLRKCLSNLHSRRGWLYMGVFEHAPDTGRLHFHGLVNVPDGQMIGDVYERRDYSTKSHRMVTTHSNTFFEVRFGRNDFSSINSFELKSGKTLNYILKYIEKTDERIIYSRGIPTDFYKEISDSDIAAELFDFIVKYVVFDDVIDYERDVLHFHKPEEYTFVLSDFLTG